MVEHVLHIPCPECKHVAELTAPADTPAPVWIVQCENCTHQFGVFVEVTKWPTARVVAPLPMRIAD